MLDFGALPPEVNSGRMYAGPGSAPLMVAATAWDELGAELGVAASGYGSVVSELTGAPWVGPASMRMVAAAAPFVSWLGAAAAQAEETAAQARAAAAAFEMAFMMTVPPPVIAANRVLLMTLIATNFFGQNTAAIAATEAQYMEMWAQDAGAMYGYAGSSAAASQLSPFSSPSKTTTSDGVAGQAVAVAKASATPAGNSAQTTATTTPQLASATGATQALQHLSSSTGASTSTTTPSSFNNVLRQMAGLNYFGAGLGSFGSSIGQQLTFGTGTTAGAGGAWYATPQFAGLALGGNGGGAAVSANLASATKIGGMSVPPGWAGTPGALEHSATAASPINYAAGQHGGGTSGLLRGLPMGSGTARRSATAFTHKYGFRQSVLVRPPSAG